MVGWASKEEQNVRLAIEREADRQAISVVCQGGNKQSASTRRRVFPLQRWRRQFSSTTRTTTSVLVKNWPLYNGGGAESRQVAAHGAMAERESMNGIIIFPYGRIAGGL